MKLVCSNGGLFPLATQSLSLVRNIVFRHFCTNSLFPQHPELSRWNSVLKSCIPNKNFRWTLLVFRQMLQCNVKPNHLTFSLLIKACALLSDSLVVIQGARQLHTHLLKSGFDRFVHVGTALLDLYAKCGCILFASQLFEDMPHRDLVSWNSLIHGYSHNGHYLEALGLFFEMLKQGTSPCRVTLVSVMPSCARPEFLFQGKSIHGYGAKVALDLDSRVKNVLTFMYAKCSDLDAARLLFEGNSDKSVVSWNIMIGAYGQNGYLDEALLMFKQMFEEDVSANSVTIVSLLSANSSLVSIHSYTVKSGLITDGSVITSLVCMYARCRNVEMAGLLYDSMPLKNLVSLTAVISSYGEKGDIAYAMYYFNQMRLLDMEPDAVVIICLLNGFKNSAYIGVAIALHGLCIKIGLVFDTLVINGLISMYAKFNYIEDAFHLFPGLHERPLISWNSIISACIQAGWSSKAIELFSQMKMFGCYPDSITMSSMLSGCSQLGSLQFGKKLHTYVLRNNLEVEDFVGTALADMYAKCGSIVSAERVFESIQNPCLATWNTIISGYGMNGLEHKALDHYSEMIKQGIEPDDITFLGVLSACSHAGLVREGQRYFRLMRVEFGVAPGLQHYAIMVDLLSRAGLLDEALAFINKKDVEFDSVIWLTLLGACCIHQEIKLAECVAKQIFILDHGNGGFYVLMSNLYASLGRWDDVARMREIMREIGEEDCCSGTSFFESTCSQFLQEINW